MLTKAFIWEEMFFRPFEVYNHLEIMVLCGHWIMEVIKQ